MRQSAGRAIGTHVDDIVLTGTDTGQTFIKNILKSTFEIKITLNPTLITGVQVVRDEAGGWLSREWIKPIVRCGQSA